MPRRRRRRSLMPGRHRAHGVVCHTPLSGPLSLRECRVKVPTSSVTHPFVTHTDGAASIQSRPRSLGAAPPSCTAPRGWGARYMIDQPSCTAGSLRSALIHPLAHHRILLCVREQDQLQARAAQTAEAAAETTPEARAWMGEISPYQACHQNAMKAALAGRMCALHTVLTR